MSDSPPPFVVETTDIPVVNPPYEVPFGWSDAPPPVPEGDPNMDAETVAYLDAFHAPPDPRDPVAAGMADISQESAEDYLDSFVKPPDPRDPIDSVITDGELSPPAPGPMAEAATEPPVNIDVPYLSQDGAVLACTMGNWENVPDQYAYLWIADGLEVGPGVSTYDLVADDVGRAYACVVTASNAAGSAEAPVSNEVTVEAFP
jgi:hypothetical protein